MKKFIICIFSLVAIIAAGTATGAYAHRTKEKTEHASIAYSNVPAPVKQFLGKHFVGEKIKSVHVDTDEAIYEYEIRFFNGIEVDIDTNGKWEEISTTKANIPMAILPEKVSTYIVTNYPKAKIVKIEQDRKGFEVNLSKGKELKFAPNGTFLTDKD